MALINVFFGMAVICFGVCVLCCLWGWHCVNVHRRKSARNSFRNAVDAGLTMLGFCALCFVGLLFL